jgi:hypothetical protein
VLISNPNKILTLSSIPILISKLANSIKAVHLLPIYHTQDICEYVHRSYFIHIHGHNDHISYAK